MRRADPVRGDARFAPECPNCGLAFAGFDVGDGPAVFLILIVGDDRRGRRILVDLACSRAGGSTSSGCRSWSALTLLGLRIGKAALMYQIYPPPRRRRKARQMIRRWPLIPTILVAAAVATMIGLGIWQLQRREEKLALLEALAAAQALAADRLADRALDGDTAAVSRGHRQLPRGHRLSHRRRAESRRRSRLPRHRRLPHRRRGAGHGGRAWLVEEPQCRATTVRAGWSAAMIAPDSPRGCGWSRPSPARD